MVFPSEQNTMWDVGPKILISISAYCSLSRGRWAVTWAVERGSWALEEDAGENHRAKLALAITQGEAITTWSR